MRSLTRVLDRVIFDDNMEMGLDLHFNVTLWHIPCKVW